MSTLLRQCAGLNFQTPYQSQSNSERTKVTCILYLPTPHLLNLWSDPENISNTENKKNFAKTRLGMSVTTQGGSGRQYVTGSRRNISKYRFVLLNVYRFWET